MSVSVQVVSNLFPQMVGQVDIGLERAFDAGVAACIAAADQLARVDTGAMRANKTVERGPGMRTITWNEEHSIYNEFGTSRMSAQPFAAPGADAALPVIEAELGGMFG